MAYRLAKAYFAMIGVLMCDWCLISFSIMEPRIAIFSGTVGIVLIVIFGFLGAFLIEFLWAIKNGYVFYNKGTIYGE